MTDNEIIKALECCMDTNGVNCGKCPYCDGCVSSENTSLMMKDTLDLINRQKAELNQYAEEQHELMIEKDKLFDIAEKQKAEIERLKKGINIELENYATEYDNKIKAEVAKEFAEKVQTEIKKALESNYKARAEKEKEEFNKYLDNLFWNYCTGKIDCLRGIDDFIDNLLKETVGDADGKRKEEIP